LGTVPHLPVQRDALLLQPGLEAIAQVAEHRQTLVVGRHEGIDRQAQIVDAITQRRRDLQR
jgi:hypothetical protein